MDITCTECAKSADSHRYDLRTGEQMLQKQLCFSCNYWTALTEKAANPNSIRVGGSHYWYHRAAHGNKWFLGFGGHWWGIRHSDGREQITNNLWHQGAIPAHFLARLPDNATFFTPTQEQKDKALAQK